MSHSSTGAFWTEVYPPSTTVSQPIMPMSRHDGDDLFRMNSHGSMSSCPAEGLQPLPADFFDIQPAHENNIWPSALPVAGSPMLRAGQHGSWSQPWHHADRLTQHQTPHHSLDLADQPSTAVLDLSDAAILDFFGQNATDEAHVQQDSRAHHLPSQHAASAPSPAQGMWSNRPSHMDACLSDMIPSWLTAAQPIAVSSGGTAADASSMSELASFQQFASCQHQQSTQQGPGLSPVQDSTSASGSFSRERLSYTGQSPMGPLQSGWQGNASQHSMPAARQQDHPHQLLPEALLQQPEALLSSENPWVSIKHQQSSQEASPGAIVRSHPAAWTEDHRRRMAFNNSDEQLKAGRKRALLGPPEAVQRRDSQLSSRDQSLAARHALLQSQALTVGTADTSQSMASRMVRNTQSSDCSQECHVRLPPYISYPCDQGCGAPSWLEHLRQRFQSCCSVCQAMRVLLHCQKCPQVPGSEYLCMDDVLMPNCMAGSPHPTNMQADVAAGLRARGRRRLMHAPMSAAALTC